MMSFKIPEDKGAKKRSRYWNLCMVLGILSVIFFTIGVNEETREKRGEYVQVEGVAHYECSNGELFPDPNQELENDGVEDCRDGSDEFTRSNSSMDVCFGVSCCFSVIFAISALSTKNDERVVVIQQPGKYIVQQVPVQQNIPKAPTKQPASGNNKQMWAQKAANLELARNWEGAAEAYEKAGMYVQAGKIRQDHLENSKPVVQIGQVGNTVLNDSVMISDNSQKICSNCGNPCDANWNICPKCTNPL